MNSISKLFMVPIFLIAACGGDGYDKANIDEAKKISDDIMIRDWPQVNLNNLQVTRSDLGDRWRISYDYEGGSTGGPFVFEIRKKDGEVIHREVGQ